MSDSNSILFKQLTEVLKETSGLELLIQLTEQFPGRTVFSSSFSEEDQLISHWIFTEKLPIKVFTLDTGRLFPETYSTWSRTLEKYSQPIEAFYPQSEGLQQFTLENGPNAFYESVEMRKKCCEIRKVEPLQRALKGAAIWVTGIRAAHSSNRNSMPSIEWDPVNNITKIHPLLHWSHEEVKSAITEFQIPSNPLHSKGFVSIGCAPCTRAIKPGEDFRAGRWWWEDSSKKECGLHSHPTPVQH